jgi:hypothetical protein
LVDGGAFLSVNIPQNVLVIKELRRWWAVPPRSAQVRSEKLDQPVDRQAQPPFVGRNDQVRLPVDRLPGGVEIADPATEFFVRQPFA